MFYRESAAWSVMMAAMMLLVTLGIEVETAPTERDPLPRFTHTSAAPEKSSALNLSHYLKQWLVSTKAAGVDGTLRTTTRIQPAGTRAGKWRSSAEAAAPARTGQMLKMISALEDLQRTFNSTLSSRITIMPRAHGRGRKNKVVAPAEGAVKPTTAPPAAVDSTASRASADVNVPGLTGRNFRKSLPPQNKKANKRVCFWKYCSQN